MIHIQVKLYFKLNQLTSLMYVALETTFAQLKKNIYFLHLFLLRNNLNVVLKRLAAEPFFGNYKLQTVGDVSINNHPRLGRARHLRVTRNKFN